MGARRRRSARLSPTSPVSNALPDFPCTPGSRYAITYLIDSNQDRTSANPTPSTVICLLQVGNGQALTGCAPT